MECDARGHRYNYKQSWREVRRPVKCEVSRFGRNIHVQQGLVEALDARHPHIVMRRSPQPGMEQFAPATECNFNHVLDSAEVTLMGVRRNYTFIIDESGNV